VFYLVAVEQNQPVEIVEMMRERGFDGEVSTFVFRFADEDCVEEEGWKGSSLCSSLCQETRTLKDMT
jgi:hypothetical protein